MLAAHPATQKEAHVPLDPLETAPQARTHAGRRAPRSHRRLRGARVSALTSSERHATDDFISIDIPGRIDLFDDTQVHEIAIDFDMADYDRLIAAYQQNNEKEFIEASITIDGTTISPVGIRLKGNSTIMGLRRAGQTGGADWRGQSGRARRGRHGGQRLGR